MAKIKLVVELLSYWHAGSGSGEGASLDALVIKTKDGLPYIPGRTIKGLLRDGMATAEEYKAIPEGSTKRLFGSSTQVTGRFDTEGGALSFGNATLGAAMDAWARGNKTGTGNLFNSVASTSIDDNGLASPKSLRRIEVAVPLTLMSDIEIAGEDDGWRGQLETAAKLVRHIGSHRRRGLGRAEFRIIAAGEVNP